LPRREKKKKRRGSIVILIYPFNPSKEERKKKKGEKEMTFARCAEESSSFVARWDRGPDMEGGGGEGGGQRGILSSVWGKKRGEKLDQPDQMFG